MRAGVVGLMLVVVVAQAAQAQNWELTAVIKGDSMFTDLDRIERVAPHVYRAWSKYVYVNPATRDTEAMVQKEYDCEQGKRRVFSAVFYNADRKVTWESKKPGPWTPVTRQKGRRQWSQVCNRVEGGVMANLIGWLKSKL